MSSKKNARNPARAADGSPTPAGQADPAGICARLAQLRRSFAGERGQSRFAEQLGLTPSTYGNYEKGRTPPPQVLIRAAELTGADPLWLLTGRSGPQVGESGPDWAANPQHRAILQRAAGLLADRPANLAALAAFLDLLAEKTLLEQSLRVAAGPGRPEGPSAPAPRAAADFGRWVPIFGRAAAGLARFWAEISGHGQGDLPEPAALDRMIHEAAELSDADSHLAVLEMADELDAALRPGPRTRGRSKHAAPAAGGQRDIRVRLVQLSEPITDLQLTEFLEAPQLADRYRPLFGLRLDGDSMAPMFADGVIVLCCPSEPARPGGPAVVRLAGQIGLTCKLYRPRGEMIRLVPANDKYPAQEFPARQLDWALAVLGSVRLD